MRIMFRHSQRGRFSGRVELTLQDTSRRTFVIIRQLHAVVGTVSDHELLKADAPYARHRPTRWRDRTHVVEGTRPPALNAVKWVKKLENSEIPPGLQELLKNGSTRKVIGAIRGTFLPQTLTYTTHERYYRLLLWLEEHRLQ